MLAFVRAAFAAALVLLLSVPAFAADKPFQARRSRRRGDQAGSPDQGRSRARSTKPAAALRREADAAFQRNDFRSRHADPRADRRGRARDSANWLRLAQRRPADPAERRPRDARSCSSAPRPPPTSPISAPAMPARRPTAWSCSAAPLPIASCGVRRSMRCASRSNCARSRTCASNTSGCARSTASACSTTPSMRTRPRRAPASSSPKTCPASAPISRPSSPSPARTSRRSQREEKQLCVEGLKHGERYTHHAARRPAVDREGDAAEIRRLQHLCARPQARSCASPARPMCCRAPASAAFRWSASIPRRWQVEDLSHRRPQPDRHGAGQRLPAQPRPLRARPPGRRARRAGLERRDDGRADAQRRRHHRLPGRSGDRRPRARRLCDGGASRRARSRTRLRAARDAMVHRLRSRPDRVLRQ